MKKNVLMRAASGLLVATMLTTCAISGTFAKYVTQDNGGDMARVAKWGVVVQVEGDLYGQKYLNVGDGTGNTVTAADDTTVGVDGEQIAPPTVVAPGSKSDSPFTFGINGKPEVDSQTTIQIDYQNIYLNAGKYGVMVQVETGVVTEANYKELATSTDTDGGLFYLDSTNNNYVKVDPATDWAAVSAYGNLYTLEDYVDNGDIYYPVAYTLAGETPYTLNDVDNNGPDNKNVNTLERVSKAILAKVGGTDGDWTETAAGVFSASSTLHVERNTDLATQLELSAEKLTWEWEFHDSQIEAGNTTNDDLHEDADHNISQQDKLDTILGNLMAERKHLDDTNKTTFPKGQVVKANAEGTAWAAPKAVTKDEVDDFCLDTKFNICITVEQVD